MDVYGKQLDTVDGSEIRRSPVDMVNIPILYRVLYIKGGWPWDFRASTVVHPQKKPNRVLEPEIFTG